MSTSDDDDLYTDASTSDSDLGSESESESEQYIDGEPSCSTPDTTVPTSVSQSTTTVDSNAIGSSFSETARPPSSTTATTPSPFHPQSTFPRGRATATAAAISGALASIAAPSATSSSSSSFFHHHNNNNHNNGHNHPGPLTTPPISATPDPLLPPFYNRPPTPVPPSPSFASLLAPTTHSAATAPATPYASDEDLSTILHHLHHSHPSQPGPALPPPPTSPKVPTYEYYGFLLQAIANLSWLVFLLWSFLPSPLLHGLGIYYYPDRWWSVAIPSWVVVAIVYILVSLGAYNVEVLTRPLEGVETVVDGAGKIGVVDGRGRLVGHGGGGRAGATGTGGGGWRDGRRNGQGGGGGDGNVVGLESWCVGTDGVLDVPLAGVCEMLYSRRG